MRRLVLVGLVALVFQMPLGAHAQQPAPPPATGIPTSELLVWLAVGAVIAGAIWAALPATAAAGAGEAAAMGAAGAGGVVEGAGAAMTGAGQMAQNGAVAVMDGAGAAMTGMGQMARNGAVAVMDGAETMMAGARDAMTRVGASVASMGRGAAAAP